MFGRIKRIEKSLNEYCKWIISLDNKIDELYYSKEEKLKRLNKEKQSLEEQIKELEKNNE